MKNYRFLTYAIVSLLITTSCESRNKADETKAQEGIELEASHVETTEEISEPTSASNWYQNYCFLGKGFELNQRDGKLFIDITDLNVYKAHLEENNYQYPWEASEMKIEIGNLQGKVADFFVDTQPTAEFNAWVFIRLAESNDVQLFNLADAQREGFHYAGGIVGKSISNISKGIPEGWDKPVGLSITLTDKNGKKIVPELCPFENIDLGKYEVNDAEYRYQEEHVKTYADWKFTYSYATSRDFPDEKLIGTISLINYDSNKKEGEFAYNIHDSERMVEGEMVKERDNGTGTFSIRPNGDGTWSCCFLQNNLFKNLPDKKEFVLLTNDLINKSLTE